MQIEETVSAAAPRARCDDAAPDAIDDRLLATIAPQRRLRPARWRLPVLNRAECVALRAGMKDRSSPEAFVGLLARARSHLEAVAWGRRGAAVGVRATAA